MQIILSDEEIETIYGSLILDRETTDKEAKTSDVEDKEVYKQSLKDINSLIDRFTPYVK